MIIYSCCPDCGEVKNQNDTEIFIEETKELDYKHDSDSHFSSNQLYTYKIKDFVTKKILDTTFVLFKKVTSKDSLNLKKLLGYNFSEILLDTNYKILDSLIVDYPYDFPSGSYKNYFDNVRIQLSNDLEVSFAYTKELKHMEWNYDFNDRPTIEKIKKERFDRFEIQFHEEIVISVENDAISDSLVIYLPYEIK